MMFKIINSSERKRAQLGCGEARRLAPRFEAMTRTKERHLLVEVSLLGGDSKAVTASVLHHCIRATVRDHFGDSAVAALQTNMHLRHYAPQAQLCIVQVAFAQSRMLRDAISRVRHANQRPIRLRVVRTFGNATVARRELARRLEEAFRVLSTSDARARKGLLTVLDQLAELQKR
jgi:RNase P/RNase MRP subunit POP5